jgi:type VI secretion system protein ImpA
LFAIDALLAPVDPQNPSGPDLEYDAEFLGLVQSARGKPEQQFGETVIPAQEPNWQEVRAGSEKLFARTRDLRVAMLWLRGATNVGGYEGFVDGIALIGGLLTQYWDTVHPQLDASDNNDPTMRLNAMAALVDPQGVLRDVRQAAIGSRRGAGALRVRSLELALGNAEPGANESAPTEAGVRQALAEISEAEPALAERLVAANRDLKSIEALLDERAGAAASVDLQPLRKLTALVAAAGAPAAESSPESQDDGTGAGAVAGAAYSSGPVRTREEALRALDHVCDWLARNEPTNPAPLVIRRARRLMTMSFLEIIRDVAPGGVDEVMNLVGNEPEKS